MSIILLKSDLKFQKSINSEGGKAPYSPDTSSETYLDPSHVRFLNTPLVRRSENRNLMKSEIEHASEKIKKNQ